MLLPNSYKRVCPGTKKGALSYTKQLTTFSACLAFFNRCTSYYFQHRRSLRSRYTLPFCLNLRKRKQLHTNAQQKPQLDALSSKPCLKLLFSHVYNRIKRKSIMFCSVYTELQYLRFQSFHFGKRFQKFAY